MFIAIGQRRWTVVPVAAGLTLLLLLGAIAAGLRVPGFSYLAGLPGFGGLDYRTLSGSSFLPLRADYLDQLLGTGFGGSGSAPELDQAASLSGSALDGRTAGPVPALQPTTDAQSEQRPVVLDHDFTNDDIERAVVIPQVPFTARTSTVDADRQAGEPTSCSSTGGTAWYRYSPSRTHPVFADTFGTARATAIGVFRGTGGFRNLVPEGCGTDPTGNAQVGFTARAGSTYYFQLAGVLDGPLVFHLSPLGTTSRVPTLERAGVEHGQFPAVSGDGRYVAFTSLLAPTCPFVTCEAQVLLVDRQSGRVTLVSRTPGGRPGNGNSAFPTLSHDGRYVGFGSSSSDLVPEDSNDGSDYFVHDRVTGKTVRASVSSGGAEGSYPASGDRNFSTFGSISPEGRFAVFATSARGLTADDQDGVEDVFVRDLMTGRTTRESVQATTTAPRDVRDTSGAGFMPRISLGGQHVAFRSFATDLVAADYGDCRQRNVICANVFVRDRRAQRTELLSRTMSGKADNHAGRFFLSYDGRVTAWASLTEDIVAGDTNKVSDVFVHDARTGRTVRVSVSSSGVQQNDPGSPTQHTDAFQVAGTSRYVSLSADGRHVAFDSRSTNLVDNDNNGASDIFVHDVLTGATLRASVSSRGEERNADSLRPALSADGRVVVFQTDADLEPGDGDKTSDIYVHDRRGA